MTDINKLLPNIKPNQPLAPFTTFKIGGPAEYLYQAKTTDDLVKAVKAARQTKTPFTLLGNASNVLISDQGIKGLVIINQTNKIKILKAKPPAFKPVSIPPRYQSLDPNLKSLSQLEYDQSKYPPVLVQLDSGVFLPQAIFSLINQSITGLEWFAGIPATVGGATFINLHGGHKYFSDYLVSASILTPANQTKTVKADYFNFNYDDSTLKTSQDIVLTVTLRLYQGPKDQALNIAKTWAQKKSLQPQRSAGCIFQNLSNQQQADLSLPTPSIGYLIDKKLNLKAKTIGQAKISAKHAGFIENLGQAKAKDVMALIKLIKTTAKQKLKLDLKLEIVPLGFNDSKD